MLNPGGIPRNGGAPPRFKRAANELGMNSAAAAAEPDRGFARARRGTGGGGGEAPPARGAAAAAELRRRRRRRGGGGGGGARTRAPDDDASDVPRVRGPAAMQELCRRASMRGGPRERNRWGIRPARETPGPDRTARNPGSASLVSGRDDPPPAAAGLVSSRSAGATSLPSAPADRRPRSSGLAEALTPTRVPGELARGGSTRGSPA